MSDQPDTKRQKTADDTYHLIYWPGIPGRGEFIRLALEYANAKYTDTAHTKDGMKEVLSQIAATNHGSTFNPPPLAPPVLQHGDILISQTPNILQYLAPRLGLIPSSSSSSSETTSASAAAPYHIHALALTALDGLSNEPHDTHHPISVSSYYTDQKDPALLRAADYRHKRLPKFLSYFERVLSSPSSNGGRYLYNDTLSYADLVLFQCIDGVKFAFPKAMKRLEESGKYERVFGLWKRVREEEKIKAYLESGRRQGYGGGIYRHYPELDDRDDETFEE